MPMPQDMSCRRAAGMAAVKDALENNDNTADCSSSSVRVDKMNSLYQVTVTCGNDQNDFEETTYKVKTRLKSKKSNSCRVKSVEEVKADSGAKASQETDRGN
jgi:hypothetical protein